MSRVRSKRQKTTAGCAPVLRRLVRVHVGGRRTAGQATVEFALTSMIFFMLVFGIVDLGRSVYIFATLHNAVREGARVGKVKCGDSAAIKQAVKDKSPTLALPDADITVTPPVGGCIPPGKVTVAATTTFTAVTQSFLGITPITLNASAIVDVE